MKKALPWIIVAVLVVILLLVYFLKSKKDVVNESVGTADDSNRFPVSSGQMQFTAPTQYSDVGGLTNPGYEQGTVQTITAVVPSDPSITPPVVQGASMSGATCINHPVIVAMIEAWKESGLVKRIAIKQELKDICPSALQYLIR